MKGAADRPKIAFLVLAHGEPELLRRLLNRLSEGFGVYLHLDRAAPFKLDAVVNPSVKTVTRRRRTYWGSFACTQAILDLLELARTNGHTHYVLISGQDVPIKSNSEIMSFFETNSGNDFIRTEKMPFVDIGGGIERITRRYWHAYYRYSGLQRLTYKVWEYVVFVAYKFFLPEKILAGSFFWGETWFALRDSTVTELFSYLEKNPDYLSVFRGSRLAEEIVIPTILRRINAVGKNLEDPVTFIDWETGPETPRVLDQSDIPRLQKSRFLFARKVSSAKSAEFIQWAYTREIER